MTTMAERTADMLEFDLQPEGSTGAYFYRQVLLHLDVVARNVFAVATPCTALGRLEDRELRAEPQPGESEALDDQGAAPLVDAIEDLRNWLHVTYDELAHLLGWRSASNLHHWRRAAKAGAPVRPRASSVEPILRLHALLRALTEAISGDDPSAVYLWSRTAVTAGGLTPLDLLAEGRLDQVERLAAPLLFDRSSAQSPAWRLAVMDEEADLPAQPKPAPYETDDFD
jgi:hypothetical protein